jgi:streptogramin lyase
MKLLHDRHRPVRTRMTVELLEDRAVPTTISIADTAATEGDTAYRFTDSFVAPDGYGLAAGRDILVGPDGNVYVASHDTDAVKVFEGNTGRFLHDLTTPNGEIDGVWGMTFGPDGRLYVGGRYSQNVVRFDLVIGSAGVFVPTASGGLNVAVGLTFGPDGSLYVSTQPTGVPTSASVKRYDAATGAYLGDFVAAGSGGLNEATGVAFGPDGHLYVGSLQSREIKQYNGQTGAFMNNFVPSTPGVTPRQITFRDGHLHVAVGDTPSVNRYNAVTGSLVDTLSSPLGTQGDGVVVNPSGEMYVSLGKPTTLAGSSVGRFAPASFAAFTISLDAPSASPVSVQFATGPGTALVGSDYVTTSGTITFAPGETTRTILVQTVNDGTAEPTETFFVNLSNPTGATIADGQGIGTITDDDGGVKFFVVDDASTDRNYRYGATGTGLGNSQLNTGSSPKTGSNNPRGVASNLAGTTVWVADANSKVYVYEAAGSFLGSWTAGSVSQPEGITTNGTDLWIVDSQNDRVYRYANGAGRRGRSQDAASSFALAAGNTNPKGIVTDGTSFWVVDDGATDRVFKYTLAGAPLGSWTIDAQNASPTGLTLDPTAPSDIWIVDNGTDRVYRYAAAAGLTTGSLPATTSFALAAGNTNPQDIADPPVLERTAKGRDRLRVRGVTPSLTQLPAFYLAPDVFDFSPIAVDKPRGSARRL